MNILLIGAALALATTITVLQRQSPYSAARKKPTPTPTATATPTPTPTPLPSPSPSPSPLASLAIYTANLAHGQGTDNIFDYDRQAAVLGTADIVAAQEASVGDLPNWDAGFASRGLVRALYYPNSSGPGNTGDGQAVWYRPSVITVTAIFTHDLSTGFISWDGSTNVDKSAVAVRVTAGDRQFVLVDTHLCWSRCADAQGSTYSAQRVAQITELLSWINATFPGEDVVIAGDMNFAPDYPKQPTGLQIDLFTEAGFADLWQVGVGAGVAHSDWGDRDGDAQPDMPLTNARTADTRRIDYFFARGTLAMQRIDLPEARLPCPQALVFDGAYAQCTPTVVKLWDVPDDQGVRLSDHNWLKLTL